MKVLLRNPARELEFVGPITVRTLRACERCDAPTDSDIRSFWARTERATRRGALTIGRNPKEVSS